VEIVSQTRRHFESGKSHRQKVPLLVQLTSRQQIAHQA